MPEPEDLWDPNEADPLDDEAEEVAEEVPEEVVEETSEEPEVPGDELSESSPDQEPAPEAEEETAEAVEASEDADAQPLPSEDEATWRKRYENLRSSRENTSSELRAKESELEALKQSVAQYLAMQQQQQMQTQAPPPQAPQAAEPTEQELIDMGFESRQQYRALQQHFAQQVSPELETLRAQQAQLEQQLASERSQWMSRDQQAEVAREDQARRAAGAAFAQAHPEFTGNDLEAQAIRDDFDTTVARWDAAWSQDPNVGRFDWTDVPSLEVAAEAARWPALADVLLSMPHLFESQQGLALARVQARMLDAETGTAPQKKPPKVDSQAVDRQLKAAHTEPAGSGPSKKAPRDELDDAIEMWQTEQKRSIFS